MIRHGADRPVYKQLADILRNQISTGVLAAGQMLPPGPRLADEYGIGVDAVRDALALLRKEGAIFTEPRVGSFVRYPPDRETLHLRPGETVVARMPTEPEQERYGIEDGTPVFVISSPDSPDRILAGDQVQLHAPKS